MLAIAAAAELVPAGGLVIVLCPTLALVAQTLASWSATAPEHTAMAVCSDDTVADDWTHPEDLRCPVSRDLGAIVDWLTSPRRPGAGFA